MKLLYPDSRKDNMTTLGAPYFVILESENRILMLSMFPLFRGTQNQGPPL